MTSIQPAAGLNPVSDAMSEVIPVHVAHTHRPVQSGLTVLARGESFVWLTGGMLVVAIGMIVALLTFVFYRGMLTFWPALFAIYPMHDGGMTAGEPQQIDSFSYEATQLGALSEPARQKALDRLGTSPNELAERVYLRVGNFELSGKHFDYLNEFEQNSAEAFYPEQVWVVERLHSGRFYGFPSAFHEKFSPSTETKYQTLIEAQGLLATLQGYATEELALSEEEANLINASLTQNAQRVSSQFYQSVMDGTPLSAGEHWEYVDDEGEMQVLPDSAGLPQNAQQLWLIGKSPETIWDAFELASASIATMPEQLADLQEELAHNDRELKRARLALRQAELDFNVLFIDSVFEQESDWVTVSIAQAQQTELNALFKVLMQNVTASEELKAKLEALFARSKAETLEQIETFQTESADRFKVFADLPPTCLEAIARYKEVLTSISLKQVEVNEKIIEIEAEMRSSYVKMNATELDSATALEFDKKANTSSDDAVIAPELLEEVVSKLGWKVADLSADLTGSKIGNDVWWVVAATEDGERIGYVSRIDDAWHVAPAKQTEIEVAEIVRAYRPNQLTLLGKLRVFGSRWYEFVSANPREAGMEGGFFPAIWGTVVMTMIMALMVVPFGVLAALYLREYATNGWIVGILRIAINNLAGVPSVVYGVFGLAFFCYVVGGYIDGGPDKAGIAVWPPATWYLMLGVVAAVSVVAFFVSFACSGSPMALGPWRRFGRSIAGFIWLVSLLGFVALIAKSPFFDGFYEANLPNPTFGKGGLIWASLTLAILTLPVVIVATEEALSAVPNSLREGSYACGAGKWQTIHRIVLPHARPGIMTGTILAMARGAGEVAPMMLVGALPMAIDLPLDGEFPFFHGSRSFMHLGFQIYALGFQGQNSEAAKPMVFTTTLLLILIVLMLNLCAIILRSRMKKRFQGVQF